MSFSPGPLPHIASVLVGNSSRNPAPLPHLGSVLDRAGAGSASGSSAVLAKSGSIARATGNTAGLFTPITSGGSSGASAWHPAVGLMLDSTRVVGVASGAASVLGVSASVGRAAGASAVAAVAQQNEGGYPSPLPSIGLVLGPIAGNVAADSGTASVVGLSGSVAAAIGASSLAGVSTAPANSMGEAAWHPMLSLLNTLASSGSVVGSSQAIAIFNDGDTFISGCIGQAQGDATCAAISIPAGDNIGQAYGMSSADAVWLEAPVVVVVPTTVTGGAGPGGNQKRRRILVKIDGQNFEVNSDAEAIALLQAAEESAQQTAKAAADKAIAKVKAKGTPKPITAPKMALVDADYSDPFVQQVQAQVDAARSRIADTYTQALDAAIAARNQQQQDDETAIFLLLS